MTDSKVDSLSLDDEHGIIKLISKDGKEYPIEKKFAFVSNLVKTSMDSGQCSAPPLLLSSPRHRQSRPVLTFVPPFHPLSLPPLCCADPTATDVPMPGVRGEILGRVVEYLVYHKGTEAPPPEKPLRSKVMKDVCKDPWDAEYIDKIAENRQQLYDLILAANYMDIKGTAQYKAR